MSSSQQLPPPRDSSSMSEQEKDRETLIQDLYEIGDLPDGDMYKERMVMWEIQSQSYLMRWGISLTGHSVPEPIPYTMCYATPLPDILPFDVMSV